MVHIDIFIKLLVYPAIPAIHCPQKNK